MATIGSTMPTLVDWVKRRDPDGNLAQIVELLNQQNDILNDIPWMESNDTASHLVTQRTSMPTGKWRGANQGITSGKSTTRQILETMGNLEDYSKVDVLIANQRGDVQAFRRYEDAAFLEGMSQTVVKNLFYGNEATDPQAFTGIMPRYNALSGIENASNVIAGGGDSTDNTSIVLVGWGDRTVHGLFPKGQQGGIQMKDLGEDTVSDGAGGEFQAYRTHFQWQCGLAIEDWRAIVRIANIDVSTLAGAGGASYSGPDVIDLMLQARYKLPTAGAGVMKPCFYVNREVALALHQLARKQANDGLTVENIGGKPVTMLDGIPVKRCDQLIKNEALVS